MFYVRLIYTKSAFIIAGKKGNKIIKIKQKFNVPTFKLFSSVLYNTVLQSKLIIFTNWTGLSDTEISSVVPVIVFNN